MNICSFWNPLHLILTQTESCHTRSRSEVYVVLKNKIRGTSTVLSISFIFLDPQGVKPASYNKVVDPEIKEIIGECICQKKEER